jgi:hypothetical protein
LLGISSAIKTRKKNVDKLNKININIYHTRTSTTQMHRSVLQQGYKLTFACLGLLLDQLVQLQMQLSNSEMNEKKEE